MSLKVKIYLNPQKKCMMIIYTLLTKIMGMGVMLLMYWLVMVREGYNVNWVVMNSLINDKWYHLDFNPDNISNSFYLLDNSLTFL